MSSNSKMVTWGGVSIDSEVDNNSDSGRGTDIIEKENKPNLDGGETISVKVPVGATGRVTNGKNSGLEDYYRDFKMPRRRRQWERQKSNRLIEQAKQQLCTCITLFCTFHISLPSLHDYDGKMLNFTFYGGRNQATA